MTLLRRWFMEEQQSNLIGGNPSCTPCSSLRLSAVYRLGYSVSGREVQSADPDSVLLSGHPSSQRERKRHPRGLCGGHCLGQMHRPSHAEGESLDWSFTAWRRNAYITTSRHQAGVGHHLPVMVFMMQHHNNLERIRLLRRIIIFCTCIALLWEKGKERKDGVNEQEV